MKKTIFLKKKRGYRVCSDHLSREEEGLQGVFKRLRRNGHQLENGLQMARAGRHSSETQPRENGLCV
jgi:hypothetical protein